MIEPGKVMYLEKMEPIVAPMVILRMWSQFFAVAESLSPEERAAFVRSVERILNPMFVAEPK